NCRDTLYVVLYCSFIFDDVAHRLCSCPCRVVFALCCCLISVLVQNLRCPDLFVVNTTDPRNAGALLLFLLLRCGCYAANDTLNACQRTVCGARPVRWLALPPASD